MGGDRQGSGHTFQDHGHFIHQLYPDIDPLDYEQLTFRGIDYQKSLELDVFARMIFDL